MYIDTPKISRKVLGPYSNRISMQKAQKIMLKDVIIKVWGLDCVLRIVFVLTSLKNANPGLQFSLFIPFSRIQVRAQLFETNEFLFSKCLDRI